MTDKMANSRTRLSRSGKIEIEELKEKIEKIKELESGNPNSIIFLESIDKKLDDIKALESKEIEDLKAFQDLKKNVEEIKSLESKEIDSLRDFEDLKARLSSLVDLKSKELEDLKRIKEQTSEKEPAHFSVKDFVNAFFGALFLGMPFAIKGLLVVVSTRLSVFNVILILITTIIILTAEIYFIGYSRVVLKEERKFGQFWVKRIIAFYAVSFITSFVLVLIFGLNLLPEINNDPWNLFRMVIILSMPCAIGAAITDLIKRYY